MLHIDDAAHATLLAALRHYVDDGLGEPDNREDHIHEIATNGGCVMASLDDEGVEHLIMDLSTGGVARPVPAADNDAQWADLARERNWLPTHVAHARQSVQEGRPARAERRIEVGGGLELRAPAPPSRTEYLRVVDMAAVGGVEIACWSSQELQDSPSEVMVGLFDLLARFNPAASLQAQVDAGAMAQHAARQAFLRAAEMVDQLVGVSAHVSVDAADEIRQELELQARIVGASAPVYMRTASPGEMALEICRVLGAEVRDEDEARRVVAREYPRGDWAYQCDNGDEDLGYWEWALKQAEERLEVEPEGEEDETAADRAGPRRG